VWLTADLGRARLRDRDRVGLVSVMTYQADFARVGAGPARCVIMSREAVELHRQNVLGVQDSGTSGRSALDDSRLTG